MTGYAQTKWSLPPSKGSPEGSDSEFVPGFYFTEDEPVLPQESQPDLNLAVNEQDLASQ